MKLKFISVLVTKVLSFFIMSSFFYMLMKQLENLIVVKKISTITIFPQARVGSRFFLFSISKPNRNWLYYSIVSNGARYIFIRHEVFSPSPCLNLRWITKCETGLTFECWLPRVSFLSATGNNLYFIWDVKWWRMGRNKLCACSLKDWWLISLPSPTSFMSFVLLSNLTFWFSLTTVPSIIIGSPGSDLFKALK